MQSGLLSATSGFTPCWLWDRMQVFRLFSISLLAHIRWFKRWRMGDRRSSCCDVITSHILSRSQLELLNTSTVIQTILWCDITRLCPKFKFKTEVTAPVDQIFCCWALVWSMHDFQSCTEHIYSVHVITAGVTRRNGDWKGKGDIEYASGSLHWPGPARFYLFFFFPNGFPYGHYYYPWLTVTANQWGLTASIEAVALNSANRQNLFNM